MKIVSACLAGVNCKYNGGNCLIQEIKDLVDEGEAIAVCPEVLGGLPIPREPAERIGNQVITISGKDVTKEYELGAQKTLELCQKYNVTEVILKSKSPSCGLSGIYDGHFNHTVIEGHGLCVEYLLKHGYTVISEEEFKKKKD